MADQLLPAKQLIAQWRFIPLSPRMNDVRKRIYGFLRAMNLPRRIKLNLFAINNLPVAHEPASCNLQVLFKPSLHYASSTRIDLTIAQANRS
ncbi:MAG: hypothetical protein ABSA83_18630 [Verrucomicrobiota bacterium]